MSSTTAAMIKLSPRLANIHTVLQQQNIPAFRLKQISDAIYKQKLSSYQEMTSLPSSLRVILTQQSRSLISTKKPTSSDTNNQQNSKQTNQSDQPNHTETNPSLLSIQRVSAHDSAQAHKVMFALDGDHRIEAVHMRFREGKKSLCISSQAGCALACRFCATGVVGLKRHLTSDEITDQILYFQQQGQSVDSVAFMGMGEPLANPSTFKALKLLTDSTYFDFSPRRVSISTVGIVPGIRKLSNEFPMVNLAFSLHTPFEQQRSELMPINKIHPLPAVFDALDDHVTTTGRKVFIAYMLLDGFNDSKEHAKAVADWIVNQRPTSIRHLFHVNLLRYNPIDNALKLLNEPTPPVTFNKSNEANIIRFRKLLQSYGVAHITTRQSFGTDIDAACGQLFAQYEGKLNTDNRNKTMPNRADIVIAAAKQKQRQQQQQLSSKQ